MKNNKSVTEIKSGMLVYLNADIESIAEHCENSEIMGFWHRSQALVGAMMSQGLLSEGEHTAIHARIAASIEKARKNEQKELDLNR
jgi:hypothetical protein